MNERKVLLEFDDNYRLCFQPSGNSSVMGEQVASGAYILEDEAQQFKFIIEVAQDAPRTIFFESEEVKVKQFFKLTQVFHFLGLSYKFNCASQTQWIFFSPSDEEILEENFTGLDWKLIDGKKVLYRKQENIKLIKEFSAASVDLLHLMIFSSCEEGAMLLIKNHTNTDKECAWTKNSVLSSSVKHGLTEVVREILRDPLQVQRVQKLQGLLLREAGRSGKKEMVDLIISCLNEGKEDCLDYTLMMCISEQDVSSCLLLVDYEFEIKSLYGGIDVEKTLRYLLNMKNLALLEKVVDKIKNPALVWDRLLSSFKDHPWKEGQDFISQKAKT